jgi:hypothetical protein
MKFLNIGVREIAKQNCHLNKVYHPFVFYRHRPPNTNRQGTNSSEENTLLVLEGGGDTGGKISNDANSRVSSCFWCSSCLSSQMLSAMAAVKDSASLANCPSCVG